MSPQFNAKMVTTRARTFASGFTAGQRAVVIVAVLGLLMGAFALSRYLSQPTWAPLYGGLNGEDASAIIEQLNTDGVPYQLANNGTAILVPQEQVDSERINLAAAGLTGAASGTSDGWSLLDEQGITATEFQQNVAYQRALSGELSNTLEAMSGVEDAVVQLAIPEPSVFSEEEDTPTASVLLKLSPGTDLTDSQVQSVTHLVGGSVAHLSPDAVTVTNQDGELLSSSAGGAGAAAQDAGATDTQTAAFESRMNKSVEEILNAIVGPNNSKVQVSAVLDFDNKESTARRYDQNDPPTQPLTEATVNEDYTGNGEGAGGTLGTEVPDPLTDTGGTGTYSREQSTVNNAVNSTIETVKAAPGGVERMTAAVVLNSTAAGGTLTAAEASRLVTNALGLDPQRGDAVQVSVLPFDTSAAEEAQKALDEAASAERTAGYLNLAKQVGLALLVLIAVIIFLRRRKKKQQEEEEARIEATASDLPEGYVLPQQAIGGNQQLALAQEADLSRDRMRDEVSAMVDNQPDDVAAMLQGWLAERK